MSLAGWIFAYWVMGLWLNAKTLPDVLAKSPQFYPTSRLERVAMVALLILASWLWPFGTVRPRA